MNHILKLTDLKIFDFIEYPNIEIKSNSVTFISGKSGCGKSTLLQLLNGVISPKSGMIEYLGKNIEEYDSVELRKEIMLCGQSVFLFDTTISENFDEFYNFREMPHLPEIEKENFLKICSLDFSLNSQCTMLSGGERQRVFIAILLSLTPKILMLDEPTSALDDDNASILLTNLKGFCNLKDITLLVVSHSEELAKKFADEIIHLQNNPKQNN